MARILVVDDDPGTLEGYARVLISSGHEVGTALSGTEGLQQAHARTYDLMLCDVRLTDSSGLDILRRLKEDSVGLPVVFVTGFASTRSVVEAMRLGAVDYVEKPLSSDDLRDVVERALDRAQTNGTNGTTAPALPSPPRAEAAVRWVGIMLPLLFSPSDPRSIGDWAKCVGMSVGALRNWCYTANVSPRRSLVFARLLRAVMLQARHGYTPEESLNFADRRTLQALIRYAGLNGQDPSLPSAWEEFLAQQTLVTSTAVLSEVRRVLTSLRWVTTATLILWCVQAA